jgi:hypothetical protein
MNNDPLGLFDDEVSNDPLGLFDEAKPSLKDKAVGVVDAGLGMLSGLPSQIVGGLAGAGAVLSGKGVDQAVKDMETIQKSNFGFGEYKPFSKKGEEYSQDVSGFMEKAQQGGGSIAVKMLPDFIGENEKRFIGELLTGSAMEMADPTAIGVGVRGAMRRGAVKPSTPSAPSKLDILEAEQAKIDGPKAPAADPAIAADVARLHDQDILARLKEIDQQVSREPTAQQGDGTIYVDPQGQAFRGDPGEEMARLGLERQTEAMENALNTNTLKPPGDPLGLLEMDQLRVANDGPQLPSRELTRDLATMEETARQNFVKEFDRTSSILAREVEPVKPAVRPDGQGMRPARDPMLGGPRAQSMAGAGWRRKQGGGVNPEVFQEGFQKLKQLADGTWLRAYGTGQNLNIEVVKDSRKLGGAVFDRTNKFDNPSESDLYSAMTGINPEARGKGLATEIYKFASELDNDVVPSKSLTQGGRALWGGMERKGISQNMRIPRKQRGALYIGEKDAKAKALKKMGLEPSKGGDAIPPNPDVKAGLERARGESDGKGLNYMESGATLAAAKRGSTAIQMAAQIIQNAYKRADLAIRKMVFVAESALKGLNTKDLIELAEVFKKEMFAGKRFDGDALLKAGFNADQLTAYTKMREMFDDTLRIQNEARAAKGKKPITPLEAYLSSRWQGDFRRPVFDKEGKLVWYLAADTKAGLEAQTKALMKNKAGLKVDPKKDHVVRFWNRKTDLESAYSVMLDILGRDDPAVAKIKKYLENETVGRGATYLNQEKHFKEKGNVRGFVGDRPGKSPRSEALALFQQQIQYAKNAYRWSEMQKAADDIKSIISDPILQETQPNNIKYIRDYFKNAIGYGEAKAVRAVEDSLRDFGISPQVFDRGVGNMKSFFILQKLSVNAGYAVANMVQTANVLPHLMDLRAQGYKANPVSAALMGGIGGMTMGLGHYLKAGGAKVNDMPGMDFLNNAFKYAEDNGVTTRSIYDESPIESSFTVTGKVGNALGKTMTVPETFVRGVAFMTFAQYLKDSGKFKKEADIFQKAEELTNTAMVDYRATERPMIFSKFGSAGNFLNTLQTFGFNYYNQWSYFLRQAGKGNFMPLLAMMAVQYAVAGAMGAPGFEDMHKLYMWMKDQLPAGQWMKLQESDFWSDPKLWMVENFGESSVYGVLSDQSGVGLTSRVSAPQVGQMLQSPVGPAVDIAGQVGALGSAVMDPTNTSKWGNVAMKSMPTGLQGLVETAPFMEGITHEARPNGTQLSKRLSDVTDHRGIYERSSGEVTLRKFGLRSQDEQAVRDATYSLDRAEKAARQKSVGLVDGFYDAVKRGDVEKAKSLNEVYVKLTGKNISNEQLENQMKDNYLTQIQKSQTAAKSLQALKNAKRMERVLQEIRSDE